MNNPLLHVEDLTVSFKVGKHVVHAVRDLDFHIDHQEVVGLVGESGSGKSVTVLAIMKLLAKNGAISKGRVTFNGQRIDLLKEKDIRVFRGPEIGLIVQNPQAALNPVFTIGNQMIETICLHRNVSKEEARNIAIDLLRRVNIPDPDVRLKDYPHHFSMGMCQRIMIAMTLAMQPKLLIADEPTASLDVTIQAQVMSLLNELKQEFGMSVLIISHDLGTIAQHCDRVMILYLGKLMEIGTPAQVFKNPKHPYTQALISAIPNPDPTIEHQPILLTGDIPSPMHLPPGCPFQTRCSKAQDDCRNRIPSLSEIEDRKLACFYPN